MDLPITKLTDPHKSTALLGIVVRALCTLCLIKTSRVVSVSRAPTQLGGDDPGKTRGQKDGG